MDPPKKKPTAATTSHPAAVAMKKPTTLLDAYEVECIRRELERLLFKQNAGVARQPLATPWPAAAITTTTTAAAAARRRAPRTPEAPAPAPPANKGSGRGVRLLGRHAVAICSGAVAVPVASTGATGRIRRRGGYREVEKV